MVHSSLTRSLRVYGELLPAVVPLQGPVSFNVETLLASTVVPKFATEEEKAREGLWPGLEGSTSLLPHPIGQN